MPPKACSTRCIGWQARGGGAPEQSHASRPPYAHPGGLRRSARTQHSRTLVPPPMPRRRRIHHPFGEINVTPLIDVVMCLIIFYLLVGKLATDRKVQIKLPESTVGAEAEPEVLIVNI